MDDLPIFSVGKDGARLTVFVAMDAYSTAMLTIGVFVAITFALVIYAKIK